MTNSLLPYRVAVQAMSTVTRLLHVANQATVRIMSSPSEQTTQPQDADRRIGIAEVWEYLMLARRRAATGTA